MYVNTSSALLFLVDTVFALYIIVVLLRVLLRLMRADFYNPVAQFVWQLTEPPLRLLGWVIPRWRNLDLAALVLALALCFVNIEIDLWLHPLNLGAQPLWAAWWSLLKALVLLCNLFTFTILIQALASWLAPATHSAATAALWSLNEPLLRPVQRFVPPIGGLDVSPLIVIIALQVLSRLLPLPGILR